MLSPRFVDELFRPQSMYSLHATKQIFQKLAHSSIMKLNAQSMGKLFDLMLMGLKYQTQMMVQSEELYHITVKHLDEMKDLVEGTGAVENVQLAKTAFLALAKNFMAYDWQIVR